MIASAWGRGLPVPGRGIPSSKHSRACWLSAAGWLCTTTVNRDFLLGSIPTMRVPAEVGCQAFLYLL
ncbi:hypothetical protein WJX77_000972 [Trebouxia sp. C0004]